MLSINKFCYHNCGPFSFSVDRGELVGLTGPSGCGKTMLLRAMCDLDPWEGEVALDGRSPGDMDAPEWRRKTGFVTAESIWWFDSVAPHFKMHPDSKLLEMLGFTPDVLTWQVNRLSSGEKQRLSICRTLSLGPSALLLDEPTTHLDKENVNNTEKAICRYVEKHNIPVLWVTHNIDQIHRLTHRAYRLSTENRLEKL